MTLIPEPRADKNGKIVTRHVRQGGASSSQRNMPAPQVFTNAAREFAQELGMAISNVGLDGYNMTVTEVMQLARRVPGETAQALLETRKRSMAGSAFDFMLVSALREGVDAERLENIALFYTDDQYYGFYIDNGSQDTYRVLTEDIRGLRHYPQLDGTTNFYRAEDDIQRKAIALVTLMQEADRFGAIRVIKEPDGINSSILKDPRLAQLAIDNAGNLRRFIDLVSERGCNVDVLIEGLNTTAPLRNGVL